MRKESDTVVEEMLSGSGLLTLNGPHFEAQQIQLIQPEAESTHVTQGRSGQTGSMSHTKYHT